MLSRKNSTNFTILPVFLYCMLAAFRSSGAAKQLEVVFFSFFCENVCLPLGTFGVRTKICLQCKHLCQIILNPF